MPPAKFDPVTGERLADDDYTPPADGEGEAKPVKAAKATAKKTHKGDTEPPPPPDPEAPPADGEGEAKPVADSSVSDPPFGKTKK